MVFLIFKSSPDFGFYILIYPGPGDLFFVDANHLLSCNTWRNDL
jgi:hypothetical protein